MELHLVIDVVLHAPHVAGEATYTIIDDDNIRLETVQQVVQGAQRRDLAAG